MLFDIALKTVEFIYIFYNNRHNKLIACTKNVGLSSKGYVITGTLVGVNR